MGDIWTEIVAANAAGIARAADVIARGGLVAVPTETVYGLAARADDAQAVAGIYRAKGRPDFNPLIVHVRDAAHAAELVEWPDGAASLADAHWPGPLTMVLPAREPSPVTAAVRAGLPTLAVRCPQHEAMQALLQATGLPLAAPSANASNTVSPTSREHVLATLDGRIDMAIDGGPCRAGVESTIVALRDAGRWELLRPGPVEVEGASPPAASGKVEAPGQLARHYSPGKPVRLEAAAAREGEFHIGFGKVAGDVSLSPGGDMWEAAARLYACLHEAARSDAPRIAIAPVPAHGVGAAINDRLRRAAA
ncbi:L-threonylcarbamoyladenylate synthase [Paraurantiacibacter namhicola]|uniref:Threonylcarbamoyl-AMP synthase n=1 Tax=Paraurantiacibacter namhicola TaxID=645517 RepID=A0A1C7D5H7_9SPHN|nr:L-threonylcarbamoyladenylate synthase [Paraurantiacibacter namhicola]ANU06736.1 Threonylcarbamoyl-AMP synthase [Paraurantiacibacter namhicola]